MKTILVVDDNKLNLATVKKVLSDEYKVIPVMRGQQALTYLDGGECDIILLDINMPEMDGFEVMEKIQEMEQCRDIPVIFLTADADTETEAHCFKVGALDFIAKPFIPEVMLARIGRILELEELRRSLADKLAEKTQEVSDLKSQSHHDPLTGLWDRVYAEEKINELLDRRYKGALLMMDVDNFKSVNDTYGHIEGDRLLQMIASTLKGIASEEDVLCRIGGDEFIIFVKNVVSRLRLSEYAEHIISDMQRNLKKGGFETDCSISIGIARTPDDGTEFTKLYNTADKALYYVKQNGKNSYHFFGDTHLEGNKKGRRPVDLETLQKLMSSTDNGVGAYLLNFENFHHVYNFIRRFVDRSNREVQTVLFTISGKGDSQLDIGETELALELLERAVSTSLRRSDVTTRYSNKQLIVILMDANDENGDMVAGRILDHFYKLYTDGEVRIDYSIARIDSKGRFYEK